MRMDHDLDARDRLDLDDYAISPVDALLAKLQIGKINEKDVHDAIALVKDVPLREADAEGELEISLDIGYLAEVCSQDWGLYHDITTNLELVLASIEEYGLDDDAQALVRGRLTTITESAARGQQGGCLAAAGRGRRACRLAPRGRRYGRHPCDRACIDTATQA